MAGRMNLTLPRSEKSVWDEPGFSRRLTECDQQRWITFACGSSLAVLGARRRGFGGGLVAMLGSTVALRAAMGYHDFSVARRWVDRTIVDRWRCKDVVQDASEESFPASDSPAWTGAESTTSK